MIEKCKVRKRLQAYIDDMQEWHEIYKKKEGIMYRAPEQIFG